MQHPVSPAAPARLPYRGRQRRADAALLQFLPEPAEAARRRHPRARVRRAPPRLPRSRDVPSEVPRGAGRGAGRARVDAGVPDHRGSAPGRVAASHLPRARRLRSRGHAATRGAGAIGIAAVRRIGDVAAQSAAAGAAPGAAGAPPSRVAPSQVRRIARATTLDAGALPPPQVRGRAGAAAARPGGARVTRDAALRVDARPAQGARRDPRRPRPAVPHAAAAAGRCRQRENRGGRASGAAVRGERLPGGVDGADRDPRRTALRAVRALARAARHRGRMACGRTKEKRKETNT